MLIFVQYLFLEALIIEAKSAFDKIDQDKNGENKCSGVRYSTAFAWTESYEGGSSNHDDWN